MGDREIEAWVLALGHRECVHRVPRGRQGRECQAPTAASHSGPRHDTGDLADRACLTVPRWLRNREEAIVREISARTLIELPPLIDAVAWSTHMVVIADELDVDTDTVHTRAVTLDDQERAAIAARLNDIHLP